MQTLISFMVVVAMSNYKDSCSLECCIVDKSFQGRRTTAQV